MTVKQFRKKVEIARKYGNAKLNDGYVLIKHFPNHWSIVSSDGDTVTTAYDPRGLEYLFA